MKLQYVGLLENPLSGVPLSNNGGLVTLYSPIASGQFSEPFFSMLFERFLLTAIYEPRGVTSHLIVS